MTSMHGVRGHNTPRPKAKVAPKARQGFVSKEKPKSPIASEEKPIGGDK